MCGPTEMRFEQINTSTGTVSYLHHDQAGSTRLLTGSTGTVTGKCSYGAYGAPTCEGTTTTRSSRQHAAHHGLHGHCHREMQLQPVWHANMRRDHDDATRLRRAIHELGHGLVYLRNRVYDPATAQFLTVNTYDERERHEIHVRTGGEGDVLYRETLSKGTQRGQRVFNGAITNGV
jgi:hypothetical protein